MQTYMLTYREAMRALERQQRRQAERYDRQPRAEYITTDNTAVIFLEPPPKR